MKKILIPIFTACFLAACTSPDNSTGQTAQETPDSPVSAQEQPDTVETDGTSAATQINRVSFNGTLMLPPQYNATVTLTMGGIIKSTNLLSGTYVSQGSVVATLENPDFITLQQTYLENAAQLEYLEAEYTRQQNLAGEQAASQKKLQQAKADYLSAKSRKQAAAAQLSLLGIRAEELPAQGIHSLLEVKAPINGFAGNVQMNVGKYVAEGESLCEIINKNEMLLRLVTYEKDLADIQVGDTVEFMVNGIGKQQFEATLLSIGQQVDEVSRSLEVYARVNRPDPLFRPGMYVTAQIRRKEK